MSVNTHCCPSNTPLQNFPYGLVFPVLLGTAVGKGLLFFKVLLTDN
jgi:hypothetical protein